MAFYAGPQALDVEAAAGAVGPRRCPHYMVPAVVPLAREPAAHGQRQDRHEGVDRARCRTGGRRRGRHDRSAHPDRAATGGRLGRTCSASPQDQIGRLDHFFDRGGSSLSAVKLAIALDRAVVAQGRHPAPGAGRPGRADRRPGPIRRVRPARSPLTVVGRGPDGARRRVVCFPYAGGNAVNFQPMARALRGSGLAVYAVELPGHDLAAEQRAVRADGAQVVEQVVGGDRPPRADRRPAVGPLLGHGPGRGDGPRISRSAGCEVRRVFLGAQLLGDAAGRRAAIAELSGLTDTDIAAGSRGRRLHRPSGSSTPSAPGTSAPPTGTTACRPTAIFLDALDTPPAHETGGAGHRGRRRGRPEHGRLRPAATASGGC